MFSVKGRQAYWDGQRHMLSTRKFTSNIEIVSKLILNEWNMPKLRVREIFEIILWELQHYREMKVNMDTIQYPHVAQQ